MNKAELRSKYKKIRNGIDAERRRAAQKIITERILQGDEYKNCDALFCFVSCGSEVNTGDIMLAALENKKHLAVPLVTGSGQMCFIEIKSLAELKEGSYHILEPEYNDDKILLPTERSIMLVPGLAYDTALYRLGYGVGYYDRYFSRHSVSAKIGIAFSEQLSQAPLPHDENDIPLDELITDTVIIKGV